MATIVADIEIKSNKDEVMKAALEQIMQGLVGIGEAAEGFAKQDCPVETGRLKSSIGNKPVISELAVYIGTNVEYAPYVEYNDNASHENGKAHFLRDAVTNYSDRYREIMEDALKT